MWQTTARMGTELVPELEEGQILHLIISKATLTDRPRHIDL